MNWGERRRCRAVPDSIENQRTSFRSGWGGAQQGWKHIKQFGLLAPCQIRRDRARSNWTGRADEIEVVAVHSHRCRHRSTVTALGASGGPPQCHREAAADLDEEQPMHKHPVIQTIHRGRLCVSSFSQHNSMERRVAATPAGNSIIPRENHMFQQGAPLRPGTANQHMCFRSMSYSVVRESETANLNSQ